MTTRSTSARGRRRRSRGFTLMEVLAALLLIGIVLPVALSGIGQGVEAGSAAKHRAEAAVLAEAKLNEMITLGSLNIADGSGDFGQEYPGYQWVVSTATNDYNNGLGLIEVTVTVGWVERGADRSLKLTTLIMDENAAQQVSGAGSTTTTTTTAARAAGGAR